MDFQVCGNAGVHFEIENGIALRCGKEGFAIFSRPAHSTVTKAVGPPNRCRGVRSAHIEVPRPLKVLEIDTLDRVIPSLQTPLHAPTNGNKGKVLANAFQVRSMC